MQQIIPSECTPKKKKKTLLTVWKAIFVASLLVACKDEVQEPKTHIVIVLFGAWSSQHEFFSIKMIELSFFWAVQARGLEFGPVSSPMPNPHYFWIFR